LVRAAFLNAEDAEVLAKDRREEAFGLCDLRAMLRDLGV